MSVPSFAFLGFAAIGAVLYYLAQRFAGRDGLFAKLVLLALNLAFFATFVSNFSTLEGWLSLLPYAGFLLAGYVGVNAARGGSRATFVGFIALIIFAFFWLKKYTFIPEGMTLQFAFVAIGLSYVFFRVLHLIIDVGQGAITERISPLSYLNYTLNFPALVSGPIQFYQDYKKTEAEPERLDLFALSYAGERIIAGLFKVLIVSALLQFWQKELIAALDATGDAMTRIALIALIGAIYPFFLYANFSGYTDFVIGAARLFRLKLPENFNNPFTAENFITFWSRWHITLSNWLKTYVYTPLLMTLMRRMPSVKLEPWFAVFAYFVTFFLVGAWHGQTAEFLFFGVLQGAGVAGNKLWQIAMQAWLTKKGYRRLAGDPLYAAAARGFTFTYFAFTLLWFWSSWAQIGAFANAEGLGGFALAWFIVFLAATPLLALYTFVLEKARGVRLAGDPLFASRYVRTAAATAMIAITLSATLLLAAPAPDIVYKNF